MLIYGESPMKFASNSESVNTPVVGLNALNSNISLNYSASSTVNVSVPAAGLPAANITNTGIRSSYDMNQRDSYLKVRFRVYFKKKGIRQKTTASIAALSCDTH